MLITSVFIFLTVIALSSLKVSSLTFIRLCSLVLISVSVMSYNAGSLININSGISIYNDLILINKTSYLIDILVTIIGAIALIPWAPSTFLSGLPYSKIFTFNPVNQYYGFIGLFSVIGSILLVSSNNLIVIYLSLEIQSFGVYILASIYRNSQTSTNAGLTYFLLGGLSSCFILLGSVEIYLSLGTVNLEEIYLILSSFAPSGTKSLILFQVAFSLTVFLAGIGFKIAAAPFHQWAPDVYDRVPTIVTLWLQTIPKIAVLGLIMNITIGFNLSIWGNNNINPWIDVIIIISVVSLIIGSIIGLAQVRIKRLLTYSTISHVGFILLALTSILTDNGVSFYFYLTQYSLTSICSIIILLAFGYIFSGPRKTNSDIELVSEFKGLSVNQPVLCICFAFLLFSIAGIPPFIGFFAKQYVLEASLTAHYGGLAIIAIIVSVVSASYYLKIVRLIQFSSHKTIKISDSLSVIEENNSLTSTHTFLISVILVIVTFYLFFTSFFLDSTRILAYILIF